MNFLLILIKLTYMKSLIICLSVHHQNTEKIAKTMAEVLQAEIKKPNEARNEDLFSYDIIGFGSGIYMWKNHKTLLEFVDNMADMHRKPVFIFSTSGAPGGKRYHKELKNKLVEKNCDVIGEFNCLGWDSFGPLKLIGGLHKNRPNIKDLDNAIKFAQEIKNNINLI